MYTIQLFTILQCHYIQSHLSRVHVCFAVTSHLHFWQIGRNLLRATTATRGWNGSWPWRRKFSRRSCRHSNPTPFNHESTALYQWAIPDFRPCVCVGRGGGGGGREKQHTDVGVFFQCEFCAPSPSSINNLSGKKTLFSFNLLDLI